MSRPRTHQAEVQDAGDLQQKSQVDVHTFPSGRADDREHRQDDVSNERRRQEPECRAGGDDDSEQPAGPAPSESEPPPQSRALARDSQALEHEIAVGSP